MLKENKEKFGLRKLSVGLASVMLGVVAMSSAHSTTVHADSLKDNGMQDATVQDVQNNTNQKEEATKAAQIIKEVAPQINKADVKAVTTTVRGGTDLVKNSDKSVASDVNKENDANVAGENADKVATASKNITDKKTVDADGGMAGKTADAVKSDEATQSFNVQKNNVNRISEKAVESNLIQDNGTQDSWADPSKYGFHYTEAGWTDWVAGKNYTANAKESHITILDTYGSNAGKETSHNKRFEVGQGADFGIDFTATVDKSLIKKGNRILLSSTPFLYKDGRHFVFHPTGSANVNVISNGVKIGHISSAEWSSKFASSTELIYLLNVDQTQDLAEDLHLHIKANDAFGVDWWGNQWKYLKGTTPDNPAEIKAITNKSDAYNFELYADPKSTSKPRQISDSNTWDTFGANICSGDVGFGAIIRDPNKSFTTQDSSFTHVVKVSRVKTINGIESPNFKAEEFNPYFRITPRMPVLNKNGVIDEVRADVFDISATKLADGLSVQQVTEATKNKPFVYSISSDGQSILFGINAPLDYHKLNQLTGKNYSVDTIIPTVRDNISNIRVLNIDYPNQANDIIDRSINWLKAHNGQPYDTGFTIGGLPIVNQKPVIQTMSDVTIGTKNPRSFTSSFSPSNDIHFDLSVYRNINIKYIDDDATDPAKKILNTDTFQTTTGTDLTYNIKPAGSAGFNSATDIAFPSNYVLNQDVTVHYGVVQDKNKDIEIHVKHLVKTIDGSSNLDLYPNIKKALNGDSTRIFHITYPAGRQGSNPSSIVQSIHFIRSGKADFSTDTVVASTLTSWKPVASTAHGVTITNGVANFDSITLPRIAGYHAQVNTNQANPAMFLVSFVANSMPSTPTDNKDQNTSKDNPDITTPKTSDDKHETTPETPSVINDGQKPSQITHDWTINSIKSNGYIVSNGVDNYNLPMIGKTGLSIIKTSSNTLAFTYIKLNTPSDYVFTLTKRHKMYQLIINKMENGKLITIKTFRSRNYNDLMKELKKMAF